MKNIKKFYKEREQVIKYVFLIGGVVLFIGASIYIKKDTARELKIAKSTLKELDVMDKLIKDDKVKDLFVAIEDLNGTLYCYGGDGIIKLLKAAKFEGVDF